MLAVRDIVFQRDARSDLAELYEYSVREWGGAVAGKYLAGLEAAITSAADFPEIGETLRKIKPLTQQLIYKKHRIFYRYDETSIIVLRVIHVARRSTHLLLPN